MIISGISVGKDECATALICDGEILCAASQSVAVDSTPSKTAVELLEETLSQCGLSLDDLDCIAVDQDPYMQLEQFMACSLSFAPFHPAHFFQSLRNWKEQQKLHHEMKENLSFKGRIIHIPHNLCHAASAFYPSTQSESCVLALGVGSEWSSSIICHGQNGKLSPLKETRHPHTIGNLYQIFSHYLGLPHTDVLSLAQMATYGQLEYTNRIEDLIKLGDDGSVKINRKLISPDCNLTIKQLEMLMELPRRKHGDPLLQHHYDIAASFQNVAGDAVLKQTVYAKKLSNCTHLCLAGEVSQDYLTNTKILNSSEFDSIFIQPCAGASGSALGAALFTFHHVYGKRRVVQTQDKMNYGALGCDYSRSRIEICLAKNNLPHTYIPSSEAQLEQAATLLASGEIIGWFKGREELGNDTFGNRCLLADPRQTHLLAALQEKTGLLEKYYSFSPVVLEESAHVWFELTHVPDWTQRFCFRLKYSAAERAKMQHTQQSSLSSPYPTITDGNRYCRVQTVSSASHPELYKLLKLFFSRTNSPFLVMIPMKFNHRKVRTPEDAARYFKQARVNHFFIEDFLLRRDY
jgi:carbamoyltransferase